MTRRLFFSMVMAAWVAALAVAPVQASDDVLNVIPQNALGFVVVNRLAETDAKITEMAGKAQLPVPGPLTMLKAKTGIGEGLDEKGCSAIVVLPGETADAKPVPLWFVPVTDFAKLIEPFQPDNPSADVVEVQFANGPAVVGKSGNYAVVTNPKHREALKQALNPSKTVAGQLASLQPWLGENEVAGVVTSGGIKFGNAKIQEGLKTARETIERMGQEENPAAAMLDVYADLFNLAAKEVTSFAVGMRFDESGALHVAGRKQFKPTGQFAKMIGQVAPAKGDLLVGLPAGPFVVAGGGVVSKEMMDALMEFSVAVMKAAPGIYGLDEQKAEEMAELAGPMMANIRGMSLLLQVGQPGDSLYSNMIAVMRIDDAKKYVDDYRNYMEKFNKLLEGAESSFLTTMKVTDIEIDGKPGFQIEMDIPRPPGVEKVPNYDQLMEKLFGPGGKIKAFTVVADEKTVVVGYTTKAGVRRALAAVAGSKPALADDEGIAKMAAMLPPGAQCIGYWSPKGTVDFVNTLIATFNPEPAAKPDAKPEGRFKLPPFPKTLPVGFAAKVGDGQVETDLVITPEVLKAIGAYVTKVKKQGTPPAAAF